MLSAVLAAPFTDWIERIVPPILLGGALVVLALRGRERRRGPDDVDEPDDLR